MTTTLVQSAFVTLAVVVAGMAVATTTVGASAGDRAHDRGIAEMHAEMMSHSPEMARMHAQMVSQSPAMARMHAAMVSGRGAS